MSHVAPRWVAYLLFAVVMAGFSVGRSEAAGTIFEVEYPPSMKEGELQFGVKYRIWIPGAIGACGA
ncbi:MAG: hypothetical protein QM775_23260 [Pirellulales bacterium]